jgi:hypothetical protein
MKCPECQSDLVQGTVAIHGTFLGVIIAGFSYQHLWWKTADQTKEEKFSIRGLPEIHFGAPNANPS